MLKALEPGRNYSVVQVVQPITGERSLLNYMGKPTLYATLGLFCMHMLNGLLSRMDKSIT
jgi:hypothetical protein